MAKRTGISREKYKNIKRMDHKQMDQFLIDFYNEAYNDGMKAAGSSKMEKLKNKDEAIND